MRKLAYTGSLVACALVAGCQSSSSSSDAAPDGSDILMGEMLHGRTGMVSVFPPREDMRVGDLYVYPSNPEQGERPEPIDSVPRYGTLEGVSAAAQKQYNERPDFPATPDQYLPSADGSPMGRDWAEASYTAGIFTNEDPSERLRMVVLPPISLTRESLKQTLPSDAINLAVGELFEEWTSVTLRPQAAESYALDLDDLLDLVAELDSVGRMVLKQPYRNKIAFATSSMTDSVWMRIVSEVLYLRAVQISIKTDGKNEVEPVYASELTLADDSSSADDDEGDRLDPAFAAIARADAINKAIRESGADVLPDSFVRVLSLNENFLSMQRVWKRPVAIAVRGLTLEIDSVTGEILASGMIGKPLVSRIPAPPTEEVEN